MYPITHHFIPHLFILTLTHIHTSFISHSSNCFNVVKIIYSKIQRLQASTVNHTWVFMYIIQGWDHTSHCERSGGRAAHSQVQLPGSQWQRSDQQGGRGDHAEVWRGVVWPSWILWYNWYVDSSFILSSFLFFFFSLVLVPLLFFSLTDYPVQTHTSFWKIELPNSWGLRRRSCTLPTSLPSPAPFLPSPSVATLSSAIREPTMPFRLVAC